MAWYDFIFRMFNKNHDSDCDDFFDIDDKKDFAIKGYWKNGKVKYEHKYKYGKLHCDSTGLFYNGRVQYIYQYKDGVFDGVNTWWFSDGTIQYEHYYKNGHRHGTRKGWGSPDIAITM